MALTQVPIELSSTPGIVDNSNATAITIDSSENVTFSGTVTADSFTSGGQIQITGANVATILLNEADQTDKNHRIRQNGGNLSFQKVSDDGATVTSNLLINSGGDISFYEDTGTTPKFAWSASNERLVLSTSGAYALDVQASGTTSATMAQFSNSSGSDKAAIRLDASGDGELVLIDAGNNEDVVLTAGGDSYFNGGNLLVGKTSAAISSDGVEARNNGLLVATRDNNKAAILNRRSSDGDILEFNRGGSPVGSIGTNSSLIYFAGTSIGLKISGTQIRPSNSTGANNDNAVDLGKSDTRFKDLYLSGGAYLGGTGSANYLDDYEEGTWTPVGQNINGSGYNIGVADYTKVGRLVSCDLRVQWTGTANTAASIGFTLPFQSDNTTDAARTGLVFFSGTQIFGDAAISTHISNNGNVVSFYKTNGGNFQVVSSNQVNGTYDWLVSFTYFTA